MNDDIKASLARLARAINKVLGHSEEIEDSVQRLKGLGYEFTLYIEATLLLRKDADEKTPGKRSRKGSAKVTRRLRSGSLRLSEHDVDFLKSLRISLTPRPPRSKKK